MSYVYSYPIYIGIGKEGTQKKVWSISRTQDYNNDIELTQSDIEGILSIFFGCNHSLRLKKSKRWCNFEVVNK